MKQFKTLLMTHLKFQRFIAPLKNSIIIEIVYNEAMLV